jgi:hypothetical protein
MITFKCQGCGVTLRLSDDKAGKHGKCPKCNASFVVPTPSANSVIPSAAIHANEPEVLLLAPANAPGRKSRLPLVLTACGGVVVLAVIAAVVVAGWKKPGETPSGANPSVQVARGKPTPSEPRPAGGQTVGVQSAPTSSPVPATPSEAVDEAWQKSWEAFVKMIPERATDESLVGKRVRWAGVITAIKPPDEYWARVFLKMPATLEITAKDDDSIRGRTETIEIDLDPKGSEWKAWEKWRVGDPVQCEGVLSKGNQGGVVTYLYLTKRDTGKRSLVVDVCLEKAVPIGVSVKPDKSATRADAGQTSATPPKDDPRLEAMRKAIVGVWNGTEEPCLGRIISFDAQGRITEDGYAEGGMILGRDDPRQGKVKYRLEANKDGAGVVVIEVDAKGAESPIFTVDEIDEKTAKMREIDGQTKKPTAPALWKRLSTEPYKIKKAASGPVPGR